MTIYIPRPTDYDYALLTQHVYQGKTLKVDEKVTNTDWTVHAFEKEGDASILEDIPFLNRLVDEMGYFGVIYVNHDTRQIVVAHRGTDNLKTLLVDDIQEIYFGKTSTQHKAAYRLVEQAVTLARSGGEWHLSFTGHSLGAFLAELSVLYCLRSDVFDYSQVSAVTFESPGSRESLEKLNATHADGKVDLDALDITSYLSYPNIVNTAHRHVGTLYSLMPDVGKAQWRPDWYTRATHSMDNIVTLFANTNGKLEAPLVLDWPVGNQRGVYDEQVNLENGQYDVITTGNFIETNKQRFDLLFEGHFQKSVVLNNQNSAAIRHFSANMQRLLGNFYDLLLHDILKNVDKTKKFTAELKKQQFPENIIELLGQFGVFKLSYGHIILVQLTEDYLQRTRKTINDFRNELEAWLMAGDRRASLIALFQAAGISTNDNRLQVIATGFKKGAIINKGAVANITEGVIANGVKLEEISGDNLAEQIKQLMQNVSEKYSTITAVGFEEGFNLPEGATANLSKVEANGIVIGKATSSSTQSPMLNQAPLGKGKRQDEPAEFGESIALGEFGWYTPSASLCRVELNLAEIPEGKETSLQDLMKKYAKNCKKEGIEKNEEGEIIALSFSKQHAEALIVKLCELLVIDNPLVAAVGDKKPQGENSNGKKF